MSEWTTKPFGERVVFHDDQRRPVRARDRRIGVHPYYGASGVIDYVDGFLFDGRFLLIAEDGENLRSRSSPIAFIAEGRFWVNNHAHVVRANSDNDTRYLAYAVQHADISGYVTGSAQPKLSQDALRRVLISAPDRATQERIAAVLASLDDKIESNRRLSHLLEQEVRLLFSQDFDVEPQASGKAIPEIVEVNPRRRLPNGSSGVYIDMASMPTETALIETVQRQPARSGQRFISGDVLMARITPCLENGKVAFIDTVPRGEVGWGSTEFIVFRSKPPAPEEWAYCLVRSKPFIDFAVRNMSGTSGRQRCPASAFDSYRIQVPDAADLERFRAMAVPAFRRMGAARDESRTLAELREALLPELLSGRLRVPEADELVESVT